MDKFFINDGWPSWGWWVTILGMLGYHPIDSGSPLYSARSLRIRPRAWYLHLVRRLMLRLRAHSLCFVRSLRLRLRTKSVNPVCSGFELIEKKYGFEKLLKLTFYKSGGYSNNFWTEKLNENDRITSLAARVAVAHRLQNPEWPNLT